MNVVEGTLDPVKEKEDFHCRGEVSFVAKVNEKDEADWAHKLWKEAPDEMHDHVVHVSLLDKFNFLFSQLFDLILKEVVPAVKLKSLDISEALRGDVHSLLMDFSALVVEKMHVVVESSLEVNAEGHQWKACDEAYSDQTEKSVAAIDHEAWWSKEMSDFPTEVS